MKNRKFPFLKCCEWLYQGAISVGVLFVLYGFLKNELERTTVFPETKGILMLIAAATFVAQIFVILPIEKGYYIHVGFGLLVANIVGGMFFAEYTENFALFWGYVGLEAACIAASAMVYAIRYSVVLKGLLILAQVVSMLVLAILKKPLPVWCVGIMLTAFLLFFVELRAKERKEVFGLLPFFAAAMLLICLIPKNEEPMDWSFIKSAYHFLQEKTQILIVDIAYMCEEKNGFSFSGYGNTGEFGGSVLDSDRAQLSIAGSGTKNPLYLTGKVYEIYSGEGWQSVSQQAEEIEQANILDVLEQSIYAGQQEKFTSACQISVEYCYIKTNDLFHELNTTNLYGTVFWLKKNSPWTMVQPQGKGFRYQLCFLEVNEDSDEIKTLFRQQAWKENAVWDDELSEREAEIYKRYTVLPDHIPQRVYELAHTIAADADNDYDRMAAFADYLKDYTYTQMPPTCPDGQDVMDYFLFDSKSGYCTYFATAMAVLGRCEGIPTRYVQGFMTADTCKSTRFQITLTGRQAHAWTEFYIEHIGWVRIDATPGYGERLTNGWSTSETVDVSQAEKPDSYVGIWTEKPDEEIVQQRKPAEGPVLPKKSTEWYAILLLRIAAALLAGFILANVILFFRNVVRHKKYSCASDLEKMKLQLKRLLRLGRLRGIGMWDGETLQAYCKRVHEVLDTEEYSFARASALYEGIRFGGKNISPMELQKLEAYVEKAERDYLKNCGFLRKVIYRVL